MDIFNKIFHELIHVVKPTLTFVVEFWEIIKLVKLVAIDTLKKKNIYTRLYALILSGSPQLI